MKEFTIDYSPLMSTLYKKDLKLSDLIEHAGLNSRTVAKIKKRESMTLNTLGKICAYLEVNIESVVRFDYK